MRKALLDSFIWRGIYFITTLILNICIARIYEATQSGWIYFISNNFYLVILLGGLSLDSSMTYFSASKQVSPHKLAFFSMLWPFLVSLLSAVCTGALIYNHYITSDYLFLLVAGAAYTFGIALTNFFASLFYARHDFAMPNIYMSVINLCVIVLIPFFAKGYFGWNREQFLYIYFVQFVVQGIGLCLLYVSKYSHIKLLQWPTRHELVLLFRFTFVALSANIAYYLISRIDYLFVEAWCSSKALGNYVQVAKMGQLFLIIPSIISSTVYPQAAMADNPKVIRMILRLVSLFVMLYIVIFGVSYFISDQMFTWLFGNTFNEMYVPFLILLPGILFLSIHIIISAYFGGKNKPFYNVISTGTGLVIVLAGDVFLIKSMGITGAALVSSVGYTAAFCVSLFLFMKMTRSSWKDILSAQTFRLKTYTELLASKT